MTEQPESFSLELLHLVAFSLSGHHLCDPVIVYPAAQAYLLNLRMSQTTIVNFTAATTSSQPDLQPEVIGIPARLKGISTSYREFCMKNIDANKQSARGIDGDTTENEDNGTAPSSENEDNGTAPRSDEPHLRNSP